MHVVKQSNVKKVLVIKMSSIGDIIHTFPALTDAMKAHPNIRFDWVVEAPFVELPRLHKGVDKVLVSQRRAWQKRRFSLKTWSEKRAFKHLIQQQEYDFVIENQYTRKGAKVAKIARGIRCGLDKRSADDADISRHFDHAFYVSKSLHAIERTRKLFALALDYEYNEAELDFGIDLSRLNTDFMKALAFDFTQPFQVFCQGTTWQTKHLPPEKWVALLGKAKQDAVPVILPWTGQAEKKQVENIVREAGYGVMLPEQSLTNWAAIINASQGVIGVDTGLTHLAAALEKPTLALFGPTNPFLTGVKGMKARNEYLNLKCSPCMSETCARGLSCLQQIAMERVWLAFNGLQNREV